MQIETNNTFLVGMVSDGCSSKNQSYLFENMFALVIAEQEQDARYAYALHRFGGLNDDDSFFTWLYDRNEVDSMAAMFWWYDDEHGTRQRRKTREEFETQARSVMGDLAENYLAHYFDPSMKKIPDPDWPIADLVTIFLKYWTDIVGIKMSRIPVFAVEGTNISRLRHDEEGFSRPRTHTEEEQE